MVQLRACRLITLLPCVATGAAASTGPSDEPLIVGHRDAVGKFSTHVAMCFILLTKALGKGACARTHVLLRWFSQCDECIRQNSRWGDRASEAGALRKSLKPRSMLYTLPSEPQPDRKGI